MMIWMNCFFQYLAISSIVSVTVSMITKKTIRFSGAFGLSKTSSPVSSKGFAISMDRRCVLFFVVVGHFLLRTHSRVYKIDVILVFLLYGILIYGFGSYGCG